MFNARRIRQISISLLSLGALLSSLSSTTFGVAPGGRISNMTNQQESQQKTEKEASPPPQARPEDVASMDAILAALYDVISGPAGKKRDWNRMRSLFIPEPRC